MSAPCAPRCCRGAIALSLLLFVQLSFGKQLLADFDGSHDLFMYFAGTLVMFAIVRSLDAQAPSRPTSLGGDR